MHPIIYQYLLPWGDSLTLYSYGFFLFLSTVIAFFLFIKLNSKTFDVDFLINSFFKLTIVFYLSSYLLYITVGVYVKYIVTIPPHGFYFLGGSIVSLLYLVFIMRRQLGLLPEMLDNLVFSLMPALVLVNIGTYLAGCCFGTPTSLSIGIVIAKNSLGIPLKGAVHPVQIYSLINSLQIILFLFLSRSFIRKKGILFILFLFFWFVFSFVGEFFRGDVAKIFLGFSFNQFLQLILFLALPTLFILHYVRTGSFALFKISKKAKKVKLKPFSLKNIFLFKVDDFSSFIRQIKIIFFILLSIFLFTLRGQYWNDFQIILDSAWAIEKYSDKIFINIPSCKLFYNGKEYMISPGKYSTQTPIGTGRIASKRESIRFVYTIGWRKGEVIKYGHNLQGDVIKIPYSKMRGLGIKIQQYSDYVIHSTTEDWNIGKPASSGCIRMRIPDILDLFNNIKIDVPVVIDYILSEYSGTTLTIYEDFYNLKSCFVDGERVDFFEYTHDMVLRKTKKSISYTKLKKIISESDYDNGKIEIPLRNIVEN